MFDTYQFEDHSANAQSSTTAFSRARHLRTKKRTKTAHDQADTDGPQSLPSSSEDEGNPRKLVSSSNQEPARQRKRHGTESVDLNYEVTDADNRDEPASVSFEVNLQTWISCLNIFGGVGPSRPHGLGLGHPQSRTDAAATGGGASSGNRGYGRTRDSTVDSYGVDRGSTAGAGFDRTHPGAAVKATRMRLSYQGRGHPLVLELEQEANVVTRCSISTYEPSFLTDMVFDPRNMVAQVIVGSELMQSAFAEIDASCKKLSILISSPQSSGRNAGETPRSSVAARGSLKSETTSMLRFRAISDTGSSEMEFPASLSSADPTGVIEKFVALPGSSEQWYDFTLLSRTMPVLRSSIKTSLRMDEAGLISFQFMMPKYRRGAVAGTAGAPAGSAAGQAALEDEQDAFCEVLVRVFHNTGRTSGRYLQSLSALTLVPFLGCASSIYLSCICFLERPLSRSLSSAGTSNLSFRGTGCGIRHILVVVARCAVSYMTFSTRPTVLSNRHKYYDHLS